MGDVRARVDGALDAAAAALVEPGDWLTGEQRRQAWLESRDAATNSLDAARRAAISPNAVDGTHGAKGDLSAEAVEVVHRVASDPGRLSRAWADEMMATLGAETYTELVALTAIASVVDTFDRTIGGNARTIGDAVAGEPARVRPDNVGDVGAWVPQAVDSTRANVSRSVSLVPVTEQPWRGLVDAMYSRGPGFNDLVWADRALSRPQAELVAARTTAELECFY